MTTRGHDLGLDGTLSVVIGAADGIGAAVAIGLAAAGSNLVLASRSTDRLAETADAARAQGVEVAVEGLDASDPESIRSLAQKVLVDHGTPRVLVNGMGGMLTKPALDVTVDEWDQLIDTHLRGTFLCSQAFAPAMIQAGYGKIVNFSSTFAYTAADQRSVYSIAKAGISQLTAALSLEWSSKGVLVNAVAPAATATPRVRAFMDANPGREEATVAKIPLGRIGEPEDAVGPTLFLASTMSDFVTGHTLMVDGGWVTAK